MYHQGASMLGARRESEKPESADPQDNRAKTLQKQMVAMVKESNDLIDKIDQNPDPKILSALNSRFNSLVRKIRKKNAVLREIVKQQLIITEGEKNDSDTSNRS